jgi:hypothetical protein
LEGVVIGRPEKKDDARIFPPRRLFDLTTLNGGAGQLDFSAKVAEVTNRGDACDAPSHEPHAGRNEATSAGLRRNVAEADRGQLDWLGQSTAARGAK